MSKAPAFQFYPADFVIDTGPLNPQQIGVYVLLMCAAWKGVHGTPQCHLPDDDESLAAIGRVPLEEWKAMRKRVVPYFRQDGELLAHDRLLKELRKQQENAKRKSEGGKKGAARRWREKPESPKPPPDNGNDGIAIGKPMAGDSSSVFSFQSSPAGREAIKPSADADSRGQQQQPSAVEKLVAYLGDESRPSVEAVAAMPGTGAAWARGLYATWGPNGSMEGDRVPAAMRAEVVGIALQRYATDRDRWYGPGFKAFVQKAYTDVLEHQAAQQKADEAKASAQEREAWKARESAEIQRLNEEAQEESRHRGFDGSVPNPLAIVRAVASAKSIGGSST